MIIMSVRVAVMVDNQFAVGELVELKSGGPAMAVLNQCPNCGEVEVGWFDWDGDGFGFFNAETFPAAALKLVSA